MSSGTKYTINCTNNSNSDWFFFIYQRMTEQSDDVFSTAWLCSPYKIAPSSSIDFTWTIDYSFVWGETGELIPGVKFAASGSVDCNPDLKNETHFNLNDDAPQFTTPIQDSSSQGSLIINQASNVPSSTFTTGIGMSGSGTFVQQAQPNTKQIYIPETSGAYYIAAADKMQQGTILSPAIIGNEEITQSAILLEITSSKKFEFKYNCYSVNAILQSDNTWKIE